MNMTCIYSTIKFVNHQAEELGIPTPVMTFDFPLWVKADEIVLALNLDVVLCSNIGRLSYSYELLR